MLGPAAQIKGGGGGGGVLKALLSLGRAECEGAWLRRDSMNMRPVINVSDRHSLMIYYYYYCSG